MLLIPFAHESLSYRRMPYVAIGIISICALVQVGLTFLGASGSAGVSPGQLRLELADEVLTRPYLEVPSDLEEELFADLPATVRWSLEAGRTSVTRYRADPFYIDSVLASTSRASEGERRLLLQLQRIGPSGELEEQAHFNARLDAYRAAAYQDPYEVFGARSGTIFSYRTLTHLFVHVGWLHLIGNMLLLWLVGFNVEDRWGRAFFAVFYLGAGAVASFTQFALGGSQTSDLPLVGASGAVAAVMGVFLVHFAKTKFRVFWWNFLRFGTFEMSAYLALPLWFVHQLLLAWLYQDFPTATAHWAHIGGFACGLGLAGLLRVSGAEARFLSGRWDREDTVYEYNPDTDPAEGEANLATGYFGTALEEADRILEIEPKHPRALMLRAKALTQLRSPQDVTLRAVVAALAAYASWPQIDEALELWRMVGGRLQRDSIAPAAHLRLARTLSSAGLAAEALSELRALFRQHGLKPETAGAALATAEILAAQGRALQAVAVLDRALQIPDLDPSWTARFKSFRHELSPASERRDVAIKSPNALSSPPNRPTAQ